MPQTPLVKLSQSLFPGDAQPCCAQRWILTYMGLWFGIMQYVFTANISVAIVCMVKQPELITNLNETIHDKVNLSDTLFLAKNSIVDEEQRLYNLSMKANLVTSLPKFLNDGNKVMDKIRTRTHSPVYTEPVESLFKELEIDTSVSVGLQKRKHEQTGVDLQDNEAPCTSLTANTLASPVRSR